MKKVGVVTITGGSNYGNKLQHYAVLHAIKKLGYDAVTIKDATRRGFWGNAYPISLRDKLKPPYIRGAIDSKFQYNYHKKNESDGYLKCIVREKKNHSNYVKLQQERQKRFDRFSEKYLPFYDSQVSVSSYPDPLMLEQFCAFVCGSDQIWNPHYRDVSPMRFLTFAPKEKRIALSPSLGVSEIPTTRTEQYGQMIREIPYLSVREDTGARIIRELTGREVPVLIDPTLSMESEEWLEIVKKPEQEIKQPYVLTYFLGQKSKKCEGIISQIAAQKNAHVIDLAEVSKGEYYLFDPSEFLWLIQNAAYICTDSFHGTAFSIIFHKDFSVFLRDESGFLGDNRVVTLLKKLGLEFTLWNGEPTEEIDYRNADNLLEQERSRFWNYLKNALDGAAASAPEVGTDYQHIVQWVEKYPYRCTGCSACASICNLGALSMVADSEGFLYPSLDTSRCVGCKRCLKTCPAFSAETGTVSQPAQEKRAFVAYSLNDGIRKDSSSGGIFTELAERVLSDGAVVFGAELSEENEVVHCCVSDAAQLGRFRGLKYVQSRIGDTYAKAKMLLTEGTTVYFSGTPCQIAGLYGYLGNKNYENLITQDIICHGVPSPLVWEKYIRQHGKVKRVNFRDKKYGWHYFSMRIESEGNSSVKRLDEDFFLRLFLDNTILRPSCHNCPMKKTGSCADITLADCWKPNAVAPDIKDTDEGLSLVLVNTPKGKQVWDSLEAEKVSVKSVDVERAIKSQSALRASAPMNLRRKQFFEKLGTVPFEEIMCTWYQDSTKNKFRRKVAFVKTKLKMKLK